MAALSCRKLFLWSTKPALVLNKSCLSNSKIFALRSYTCLTGLQSSCTRSLLHPPKCNSRVLHVSSQDTQLPVLTKQSASIFSLLRNKVQPNLTMKPSFGISGVRFLPTLNQYRRGKAKTKNDIAKPYIPKEKRILLGPQRKAVCLKVFTRKPKKPNSGNRKCALLRLNNGKTITAYIPGEGAVLQEHGVVLFEGGRVQDCPGIKYKIIRRKYDMN